MITLKINFEIDDAVLARSSNFQARLLIKRDVGNRLREAYERHTDVAISEDDWRMLPVNNLTLSLEYIPRLLHARLEIPEEGDVGLDWSKKHPFGWILETVAGRVEG